MQCCGNASQSQQNTEKADFQCGNVLFSQSMNIGNETIQAAENALLMTADEQTDLFCDPKGIATNISAPLLMTEVDNTKPFTFTVKVQPQFTEE